MPQLVIGLAVTREGLPVRHWVWPGNMVDVQTVQQVKRDLQGWKLTRFVFVGDAGMVSEANLKALAAAGGRYRQVGKNLKVKEVTAGEGERRDGKFVVHGNDGSLSGEDMALGYKQLQRVEQAWRSLKSGLGLRPLYHRVPHRIHAHVSIAVLALLLERVAERACGRTWRALRDRLKHIQLAELFVGGRTVWQVTEPGEEACKFLKNLEIEAPPPILRME